MLASGSIPDVGNFPFFLFLFYSTTTRTGTRTKRSEHRASPFSPILLSFFSFPFLSTTTNNIVKEQQRQNLRSSLKKRKNQSHRTGNDSFSLPSLSSLMSFLPPGCSTSLKGLHCHRQAPIFNEGHISTDWLQIQEQNLTRWEKGIEMGNQMERVSF